MESLPKGVLTLLAVTAVYNPLLDKTLAAAFPPKGEDDENLFNRVLVALRRSVSEEEYLAARDLYAKARTFEEEAARNDMEYVNYSTSEIAVITALGGELPTPNWNLPEDRVV